MYKVKLHQQRTSIRFERPDSMLRYIQSLNDQGVKFELQFERDADEPENVPAAPLR
jgi:hypothetical protein